MMINTTKEVNNEMVVEDEIFTSLEDEFLKVEGLINEIRAIVEAL